jgi:site-specific recombinase XerD
MDTTYDVRIWTTEVRRGSRTITYCVRWKVGTRPRRESFKTSALADGFRSDLVAAARRGEAFGIESGLPISMERERRKLSWLTFAIEYVDMKWPHLAPNSRRNTARALTAATLAMLSSTRGRPAEDDLRTALATWAFNYRARSSGGEPSAQVATSLRWLTRNTRDVGEWAEPAVARAMLDAIAKKKDGASAAAGTVQRQRGVVVNLAEYAVERKLLVTNPITSLKWKAPKIARAVDKRSVVNPGQARVLLAAVQAQKPSGGRLVAFFAAMYFGALRPAEASTLRTDNLILPSDNGWGELLIEFSTPTAGAPWTNSGQRREQRQLKHRAAGDTRSIPCPPELVDYLRKHLDEFGTTKDGLLFSGVRGGPLSESTYCRVWRTARTAALTAEEARSPLAARPYDLRHAAVSTWLNAGVPSTQVAEWAGHSVAVLHTIYAKCIVGQEEAARRRIADALRPADA